jgi:hypothetical protein
MTMFFSKVQKTVSKKIFSNQKWFHTFATENQEDKFVLIATSDA